MKVSFPYININITIQILYQYYENVMEKLIKRNVSWEDKSMHKTLCSHCL